MPHQFNTMTQIANDTGLGVFLNCLHILPATQADYYRLACYHYRTEPIKPTTQIYKVCAKPPHTDDFPDPISVIVYRMPLPSIRPRNHATKGYFLKPESHADRLKLVCKKIQYIARLITDPRFQRLGLATWLLRDTLERQTVPIIETLTPIDFTNKIFQKAGFKLFQTPAPKYYSRFTDALYQIGLTRQSFTCPFVVHTRIERLPKERRDFIMFEILSFMRQFRRYANMPHGIERTKQFLSKLPYPEAYLIWFNPRIPLTDEK